MQTAEPIIRLTFDSKTLMAEHPPRLRNANKQAVYELARQNLSAAGGTITYSRWRAMPLPVSLEQANDSIIESRQNVYDYAPAEPGNSAVEWHVNFADPNLFFGYGSGLFAQDEMQVAEHPVLGSLLEALIAARRKPLTVEANVPTPVLVRGARRLVRIAVEPNAAAGRPHGLYGNLFASAGIEAVKAATHPIDPPTISNIIAMAAPQGGIGPYRRDQIEHILTTAFTAFRAATVESRLAAGDSVVRTIVHTGNWGCGAFGGHRVLMAMLQVVAARLAGVNRLVFHTVNPTGLLAFHDAQTTLDQLTTTRKPSTHDLVQGIEHLAFQWGVSDGN